jgi:hypothetical protein
MTRGRIPASVLGRGLKRDPLTTSKVGAAYTQEKYKYSPDRESLSNPGYHYCRLNAGLSTLLSGCHVGSTSHLKCGPFQPCANIPRDLSPKANNKMTMSRKTEINDENTAGCMASSYTPSCIISRRAAFSWPLALRCRHSPRQLVSIPGIIV